MPKAAPVADFPTRSSFVETAAAAALGANAKHRQIITEYADVPGVLPHSVQQKAENTLNVWIEASRKVAASPAVSLSEIGAKARVLLTHLRIGRDGSPTGSDAERLAWSLAMDLLA